MRRLLAVAAAAGALWALPAAALEDCDPEVERALVAHAASGAEDDLVIVRHPERGIRDPDSIFDLSCVESLFDYGFANILFDPGDLLGLLRRRICDAARDAYRRHVGRSLDATLFARDLPRLPGLDVRNRRGNALDDAGNRKTPGEERQTEMEDAPWLGQPGGPAPPGASRRDILRDLLGGGTDGR